MALTHKEDALPSPASSVAGWTGSNTFAKSLHICADSFLLFGSNMISSLVHYYNRTGELFPSQFALSDVCALCKVEMKLYFCVNFIHQISFGAFTRRHSCRMCGNSVCAECRQANVVLYFRDSFYYGVSVCDRCFVKEFINVTMKQ